MRQVLVFEDPATVALACAHQVIAAANASSSFSLALAGGSTPKAAYALLSGTYADSIAWERVAIYFGDERCVPPDHADSNYRMAQETLLAPLAARGHEPAYVLRMEGERAPEEAARRYADNLASLKRGDAPVFDLILLGMGPDGHTASLFPETAALAERSASVVANYVEKLSTSRLTFTYPTLNAARAIVVTATGEEKADALYQAVRGEAGAVPLRDVRPENGTMTILCDRAAASKLMWLG